MVSLSGMMCKTIRQFFCFTVFVLMLAACGPSDVLQVEIADMIEADHWGGDKKTCTPRFKILNNTEYAIERINASLRWRDIYGEEIEQPMILDSLLLPDTATRTGTGAPLYGACEDVELLGLSSILRCQAIGLNQEECIDRLEIIIRDGVTVNGPAIIMR